MWKGEKMIVMGGIMTLNNKNIALFLKHMQGSGMINCESTWLGQFYSTTFYELLCYFTP